MNIGTNWVINYNFNNAKTIEFYIFYTKFSNELLDAFSEEI